jgi:hypothetical protein
MLTFNYRVLRKQDALGEYYFEIHEVYYNESKEIEGWTANAKSAFGSTKEELKTELEYMLSSLEAPILEEFESTLREVIVTEKLHGEFARHE